jgi:hypothetical protein
VVFWHIFCICVWACPSPNDSLLSGQAKPAPLALGDWLRIFDEKDLKHLEVVRMTLFTFGTWQYWDMFAPNPADTDWYGDAIIHYKDGSEKTAAYPRMYSLGIVDKYLQERYRKFYERGHDETLYPYMFLPFAYREAFENNGDPKNPPVKVDLHRHWFKIPPPGSPEPQEPRKYNDYLYFSAEIDPTILRKMKGGTPSGAVQR